MKARLFIIALLTIVAISGAHAAANYTTDNGPNTGMTPASSNYGFGMWIKANYNETLANVTLDAAVTANQVIVCNGAGVTLGTASVSGGVAQFESQRINFTAGQKYAIIANKADGSSYTYTQQASGLPVNRTNTYWYARSNTGAGNQVCSTDDTGAANIQNNIIKIQTYRGETAPAALTATLYVNVTMINDSYAGSFALGGVPTTDTELGVSVMKWNGTHTRVQIVSNNTVLYSGFRVTQANPQYLENSSACSSYNGTCLSYMAFGGNPESSQNGAITGAANTINGTIDDIVTARFTTAAYERFGGAFMTAWNDEPTITYSSTYISNIYAPTLSTSFTPASPIYTDDVTFNVTYADGDANNGTVYIEWRVNGSVVKSSTTVVQNGTRISETLAKGNYSFGAVLNVTAWANDSLYTTANASYQVTIGGMKPDPITLFSCTVMNKTAINCTWTNPTAYHERTILYVNNSQVANLSNASTDYLFGGLSPSSDYVLQARPHSSDGTFADSYTGSINSTVTNYAPNLSTTPLNDSFTVPEDSTQNFTANASDDDGSPIIAWFKDNVFQAFGGAWSWYVSKTEQGEHNITVVANDTWGASASRSWNVTVEDTYPVPTPPVFSPNGGLFRTYIPVHCPSANAYSSVDYYVINVSVNNATPITVSEKNRFGALDFDITQYNYYTNFTFTCTAVGESGNVSANSNTFTREYVNEFYSTTVNSKMQFDSLQPYVMSLYYDASSTANSVFVQYAYADCNGDGQYDYVYNYTGANPSRVKTYFTCVFPKGSVQYEIGAYITKRPGTSWQGSGCSPDYDYANNCLVKKQYQLQVN